MKNRCNKSYSIFIFVQSDMNIYYHTNLCYYKRSVFFIDNRLLTDKVDFNDTILKDYRLKNEY